MQDSCRHVCKYTHTIYKYTVHTPSRTIIRGGEGAGLITPIISDLLPWYYPENQHCSCDHVSLHPTGESQSKEWKISTVSYQRERTPQRAVEGNGIHGVSPVSERSLSEELSAVRFSPSPTEQLSSKLVLPRVPFTTSLFTPPPPVIKLGRITPFCFSSSAVNRNHNNVYLRKSF